ncbi:hypothetical protein BDY19DRAFT_974809 [Irpex rosettiformis]|uniref:Uncharacterized protein n=1 Tax=Irpex rosettiformis TaxID=378272 RepID=A0ACB8TPH9_9APHY|nr:hypothetical protein BDY19DRAFT_974809 [Irpex rosettiformis]
MSVRRIGNSHTLPPNPEWVDFPRTDGDQSTWPTNTTRIINGGEVNFFRPVDIDESLGIMWRKVLGIKVADALGFPAGKAYVLRSFPDGYQLFDHNKGKVDSPRHDPYLYGSTRLGKNRFRSVNEFVPHAMWLAKNDPTIICECKYCSKKKTQTEISQSYGLSTKRESASVSTPPPRQRTRTAPYPTSAPKPAAPYAAVRRPLRNAKQSASATPASTRFPSPLPPPKQTQAQEKSNDIYNALTNRDVQRIRYFRKGELVWCALDPPILGPRGEEDSINFWPGLIDVVTTKPIPLNKPDVEEDSGDAAESASQSDRRPKAKVTWSVKQVTSYRIKLLALAKNYHLSDEDVLPYLSYAPSESLLESLRASLPQALQTEKSQGLAYNTDIVSDYDPLEDSNPVDRFNDAITPYTLAIQIASHIATYWSPSDEYDCKLVISPPSPTTQSPAEQTGGQIRTLQDAINVASQQNARSNGTAQSTAGPTQTINQLRYQGLWWGSERIWTDELVRLKLARCQFVPQGSQMVYPPAGPSKSTSEWYEAHGEKPDSSLTGAGEKGMFMKIESIFVVDIPRTDGLSGATKECRASGMIYELVDDDYEAPETLAQSTAESQANAKGKERAQDTDAAPSASAPPKGKKGEVRDSNLSRPVLTIPFPLPDPPKGYKFRAILPPGNECVLSLSLLAGRYYPYLLQHPHLEPVVRRAFAVPTEDGGLMLNKHLWAMEGLLPGVHQSMDPEAWKGSRFMMLKDADTDARKLLGQEADQLKAAAMQAEQTLWSSDVNDPGSSSLQQLDTMVASGASISAVG